MSMYSPLPLDIEHGEAAPDLKTNPQDGDSVARSSATFAEDGAGARWCKDADERLRLHVMLMVFMCAVEMCAGLTLGEVVLHAVRPRDERFDTGLSKTMIAGWLGGFFIALLFAPAYVWNYWPILRSNAMTGRSTGQVRGRVAEIWFSLFTLLFKTACATFVGTWLFICSPQEDVMDNEHTMASGALGMLIIQVGVLGGKLAAHWMRGCTRRGEVWTCSPEDEALICQ